MNEHERKKIVRGALDKFKYKPKPPTWEDNIVRKAMAATTTIRRQIQPILAAGGYLSDRQALQEMISRMYIELFDQGFDKNELAGLCTMLHVQIMMETIDGNPYGKDTPDLLGGNPPDTTPLT